MANGKPGGGVTVFLTGASSGIGAALARRYADLGATLGLVARRSEVLQSLADELPTTVLAQAVDVSDAAAMRAAALRFIDIHGVPDIVIANAGISVGSLTEMEADFAAFDSVLRTNVLGVVATFAPFVAPMRSRGAGTLVGISSVAGVRGLPGAGAYSASKAAVSTYLESLRVELHGSGVRVVDLAPGYIATPLTAGNPYPMPFLLPVDDAARRFVQVIARAPSRAVVPWQMALVARVLSLMPNPLYDRLFARAPRKPRLAGE